MILLNYLVIFPFMLVNEARNEYLRKQIGKFPMKCFFSLKPLIDKFWESYGRDGNKFNFEHANRIREELEKAPELLGPIDDIDTLRKHPDLVEALMSAVFPPGTREMDYYAAVRPFEFDSFYETPLFSRLKIFDDAIVQDRLNFPSGDMAGGSLMYAYLSILRKFYNIDVHFEYPLIYHTKDEKTGLDRYFRIRTFPWFVDIKAVKELPPLTEQLRRKLFDNLTNVNVWMEALPPENFEVHGFFILNAVDVTPQEVVSSLKYDLIDKDSIVSLEKFNRLEHKVRSLLKKPEILLGLAAIPGENDLHLSYGQKLGNSFVLKDSCCVRCNNYTGSVYEKIITKNETIIIEDLQTFEECTPLEDEIKKLGVRNLLLAPLVYNDKFIGILEIGSPIPGDLNAINSTILKEVLPLFAMCVKRSMDEINSQVESIIKEKCTAIHPSVEWRFKIAAMNVIRKNQLGEPAEMEEIAFYNVYPLYGLSDIRDSSHRRNEAIQNDLIENLNMAREVIGAAASYKNLPVLDKLEYTIDKYIKSLRAGLKSGDENEVVEFLRRDVESLFEQLKNLGENVKAGIKRYRSSVDAVAGYLYKRRKEFEDSVIRLNETISSYIDEEEEKAQNMFPHYFEKYKTDGVEHSLYIGQSIAGDQKFDKLHLKNLRIWQLMMICGIAKRCEELKGKLPVPLETAHLVLVQDSPLTIRFQYDEKKFDVSGTYNIRYEIMKKRIDKAEVRGKEERLTQPGKIAIVYSQNSEALEYKEYIDYLQSKGYLKRELEEMELEDLQGVHGLKALRVTVNNKSSVFEKPNVEKDLKSVLKAFQPD